ncbi:glycine cleavage system H protein, partial [Syncephalis fuscata]
YLAKKYTNDHEWITLEGDIGTMGVTNYAQKQLGEIVFVETSSEVDTIVKKEEAIGTIESVKAVSELFSPVSGTIVEVNTSLSDEPELINDDAEGEGTYTRWIYKIKLSNKSEFDGLLDKEPTDE